jgi:hypothetical protein
MSAPMMEENLNEMICSSAKKAEPFQGPIQSLPVGDLHSGSTGSGFRVPNSPSVFTGYGAGKDKS